jgi:hypothetical protein
VDSRSRRGEPLLPRRHLVPSNLGTGAARPPQESVPSRQDAPVLAEVAKKMPDGFPRLHCR